MAKYERILSLFPSIYAARDKSKLLAYVVEALAAPVEEADTLLFRIQRAHRLDVAEQADDIVKLAAVLRLAAPDFEDLLQDTSLPYARKLDLLRARIKRIAKLHLQGLGTPWAVLEAAAIYLNATIVPEHPGEPLIKHEDADLHSHKAVLQFNAVDGQSRERMYLHEGLLQRHKVDAVARYPLTSWTVQNDSAAPADLRIVIQGIGERTVMPTVFCSDNQEGVIFNGTVPNAKTLVIDAVEGATLDGNPVDEWITWFRGGITDFSAYGASNYSTGQDATEPGFDGDLASLEVPPYQVHRKVPTARLGSSTWYFAVEQGVYDNSSWDLAVSDFPRLPIGVCDGDSTYDGSVYYFEPSGAAGIAWDTRVTCSFKLLLPARIPNSSPGQEGKPPVNYVGRIGTILPRFKAAGVSAYVDVAQDEWILGQSVLRAATASKGEGIEFHSTIVRNPTIELLVQ